jgi:hypothetical protein
MKKATSLKNRSQYNQGLLEKWLRELPCVQGRREIGRTDVSHVIKQAVF